MAMEEVGEVRRETSTSVSRWAKSIDVDARLTPLDPSGKPAAPQCDSPVPQPGAGPRHDRIPQSDRPTDPRAGKRLGDNRVIRHAGELTTAFGGKALARSRRS
jgi:hypothetical protein